MWKLKVWVTGLARPAERTWQGERNVEDGVTWYLYDTFVVETWAQIIPAVARNETAGLYRRRKIQAEEVEFNEHTQNFEPEDHI